MHQHGLNVMENWGSSWHVNMSWMCYWSSLYSAHIWLHYLWWMLFQTCSTLLFNSVSSFNMWLKFYLFTQVEFVFLPWSYLQNTAYLALNFYVASPRGLSRALPRNAYSEHLWIIVGCWKLPKRWTAISCQQFSERMRPLSSPTWFVKHVGRMSLPSQHNHLDTITLSSQMFLIFQRCGLYEEVTETRDITLPDLSCAPWEILMMKSQMKQLNCTPRAVVYCLLSF